jgi:two-component system, NarL family, nitrate/nitrite response regulator NarL
VNAMSQKKVLDPVNTKLTVLIADDHKLVCDVVANFLDLSGQFAVSIAENLNDALDQIKANSGFDVVLLDLNMPGMVGVQGVRAVIEANSPGHVVFFSSSVDRYTLSRSLEFGIKGLIPKTMPAKSLVSALKLINSGETFLPTVTFASMSNQGKNPFGLTDNEIYILRLAAKGMTNKAIAHDVNQSETAIKMHMRAICTKLKASNRAHAAIIGNNLGLFNESLAD